MKKILVLTLLAFPFTFAGCSTAPAEKTGTTLTEVVKTEEDHHHDANEPIELNKGEKWTVDAPMLEHIRHMESDVSAFAKESPQGYKVLGAKLQKNVDLLTSNCTMTGQAHDELHKWLPPYLDLVKDFSDASNESEALAQLEPIKASFVTFNQYFQ